MSRIVSMTSLRRFLLIAFLALMPVVGLSSAAQAQATIQPVTAADRVLGRANAPVTVIEYASFTCPHCANWHNEVLPAFKARFIDTGRVRLVFRDLPTDPQYAMSGALLGRCAAPGKFFDVAASFFTGQDALRTPGGGRTWFDNGLAASGRSREEMQACFTNGATQSALEAEINAAVLAGVNSTPSFFVNGKRLAEDPTLDALATAIGAASGH